MSFNTPDHTMKGNQFLRLDDARVDTQTVFGSSSADDIGFEAGIPLFPLAPEGAGGYILRNAGNDIVTLINRANYQGYQGISEIAAQFGEPISTRYHGIVWLPVGAVAVVAGDYIQATPVLLDGGGATDKAFDGDIIPAFQIAQILIPFADYTADASLAIPGGLEVLQILSGTVFEGKSADVGSPALTAALTVVSDGFSTAAGSGTTDAGEVALTNAAQGVYATTIQAGSTYTDGFILLEAWVKASSSALPAWHIGHALHAGAIRVSATSFDLVPVILRGY